MSTTYLSFYGQAKLISLVQSRHIYYLVASKLTVVNQQVADERKPNCHTSNPVCCVEILDKLQTGHQGITKCRERARQLDLCGDQPLKAAGGVC